VNSVQVSIKPSDDEVPTPDLRSAGGIDLKDGCALKIFFCSLFIQSSFNYRGMQNLGFAFSMLPLARQLRGDRERVSALLTRHLQLFNTHPYLSGPIIGSVARMEETNAEKGGEAAEIVSFKNALMAPYAALGDSFFWGALKPFASLLGVLFALQKSLLAPLVFLILYNPAHLWVRIGGFVAGCRRGKNGIDFISRLNLPQLTKRIRWISLSGLGCMAAALSCSVHTPSLGLPLLVLTKAVFLTLMLLCYWGIKNGISQVKMLYWMFIISCAVSF
jgi:mannose PTS system EIID component